MRPTQTVTTFANRKVRSPAVMYGPAGAVRKNALGRFKGFPASVRVYKQIRPKSRTSHVQPVEFALDTDACFIMVSHWGRSKGGFDLPFDRCQTFKKRQPKLETGPQPDTHTDTDVEGVDARLSVSGAEVNRTPAAESLLDLPQAEPGHIGDSGWPGGEAVGRGSGLRRA